MQAIRKLWEYRFSHEEGIQFNQSNQVGRGIRGNYEITQDILPPVLSNVLDQTSIFNGTLPQCQHVLPKHLLPTIYIDVIQYCAM